MLHVRPEVYVCRYQFFEIFYILGYLIRRISIAISRPLVIMFRKGLYAVKKLIEGLEVTVKAIFKSFY